MAIMESDRFFIDMTLAVCSTLDLSEAAQRCNRVVEAILPDMETSFVYFDANDLEIKLFASTGNDHPGMDENSDETNLNETDMILRYPERFRNWMPEKWESLDEVTIVNRPSGDDLSKIMYEFTAGEPMSFLMLRLDMEGRRIGL